MNEGSSRIKPGFLEIASELRRCLFDSDVRKGEKNIRRHLVAYRLHKMEGKKW